MSATIPISNSKDFRTIWLAMLVALLTACGGGGGSDASPQSSSPAANPGANHSDGTTQPAPHDTSDPTEAYPILSGSELDALRLLEQATFGPTSAELAKVREWGVVAYLDDQLAQPKTGYVGLNRTAYVQPTDCKTMPDDPTSVASLCARDHFTLFELQRQFFANAMTGEDQLRQRIAFALSQIFVVSGTRVKHAAGMAAYQNMLLDNAFGNFRTLMEEVTLSPVMGVYLDMVNNAKSSSADAKPNENFAREFLQLFTLGTAQLNLDGTVKTDARGEPLPTYTQEEVEAYARVFTGWTYSAWNPSTSRWVNPPKLVGAMVPIDAHHDMTEKRLLNAVTLPAGQGARADLEQALDSVFLHPNVGPFIATRLIQHLVTSNPSADYVQRVARIFADNGRGVRGDMRTVIRAILLDPEARGDAKTASSYGKLKEPALFMTGFLRALGGKSDGVYLRAQSAVMGQDIFTAPSVFNFYSPSQRIPSGTLHGPEFGIFDGTSSLARTDFVYQLVYANGAAPDATVASSVGTSIALDANAAALIAGLQIDGADSGFVFAALTSSSRAAMNQALIALPSNDMVGRAKAAAYLLGTSAQFQIQR